MSATGVTTPNGLASGVILGGRELRLTLDRVRYERMKVLARASGMTPHAYAEALLQATVDAEFVQMQRMRLVYLLTNWIAWT